MDLFKVVCILLATVCFTQSAPAKSGLDELHDNVVSVSKKALTATEHVDQDLEKFLVFVDSMRKTLNDAMEVLTNVNKFTKNEELTNIVALEKCADDKIAELEDLARTLVPLVRDTFRIVPKSLMSLEKCGFADINCLKTKIGDVGAEAMDIGLRMSTALDTSLPKLMSLGMELMTCAKTRMLEAKTLREA